MGEKDDLPLEGKEKVFYVIPVAVLIMTSVLWLFQPGLIYQVQAEATDVWRAIDSPTGAFSAVSPQGNVPESGDLDRIKLDYDDVDYMNRLYREPGHEVAYCGDLTEDGELSVWKANVVNASKDHIWYDSKNCPVAYDEVIVHTQPYSLQLSETDKRSFRESDYLYSCIQQGIIVDEKGERAGAIKCYDKAGEVDTSDEFTEYEVVVGGDAG